MELVASGLSFPTSIVIAPEGAIYIAESGLPFDGAPAGGAIVKLGPDGKLVPIACGLRAPVNGFSCLGRSLIVSEGGNPGRITRIDLDSHQRSTILDDFPGFGNYHTNMAVTGPDGKLYFSQGAMTNSGVVGLDSQDLPWLGEVRHNCDIPGYTIEVSGYEAETCDPRDGRAVHTSAFAAYGASVAHRRIEGSVPCTAAIMRCDPDGANLELVAWGLRNAYGLCFLPDGRLLATDQGADVRGSRPISGCPDFLYEIRPGAWYGWPDFFGGRPLTQASDFVLANHHNLPPPETALFEFEVNSCAVKFAQIPPGFAHAGDLVVSLFGDEKPLTAPEGPRVGRKLIRLSCRDWSPHPVRTPPVERPIDIAFDVSGNAAYVLDFGRFEITPDKGIAAQRATGCVWKLPADFMEL